MNSQDHLIDWADLLARRANDAPNVVAYRFLLKGEPPARELTYAQLNQQACALASHLRSLYPPSTHIMLLFEPGIDFCLAFWACLLAGMVAVPCYPPADPRLRERFMALARDAGAKAVLTNKAIKQLITLARWLVPALRKLNWIAIDEVSAHQKLTQLTPAAPGTLALLQYTSGSTGTPRGVMLSHMNLWQNMLCLEGARLSGGMRPGTEEHLLSWLPLYHDMGLMTGVLFPIYLGSSSTLFSPLHFLQQPARWLRAISVERATISAAPNFAYEFCLRRIRDEQLVGLDLSCWDGTLNGAELIQPGTIRRFIDRFAPFGLRPTVFYPVYGLAESTVFVTGSIRGAEPVIEAFSRQGLLSHRVAMPQNAEDNQELVSIGTPFADTELRIVDPETCRLCSPDQIGEIWIRGGSIGLGYWQQPQASTELFAAEIMDALPADQGPWLRSGDLGFGYQGRYFIAGRIKDLIILQGQNYAPQGFEHCAESAHPAIRTGCVAAFGSGEPESLVILAEIKPKHHEPVAQIQAAIRQSIAETFALPVPQIMLLPKAALPKTTSGKLRRRACKDLFDAGKLKAWKP
ncbi:MAG: AMP-binding protein [Candidatus Melainabacteria bacterium HGW-Melainabacteria-1]|nr:MAG: AMP-binding protein [Candidatus Melainabacteria bacterium HGW-Melainabacteria-1]